MDKMNHNDILAKDKLEVSTYLIYNPKYRGLSSNAKFVYQYILKRFTLTEFKYAEAVEEGELEEFSFIDSEGNIFCICSNDELRFVLGEVSEGVVTRAKAELIEVGLLDEVKQTRHLPNKIYIGRVQMDAIDKKTFKSALKLFKEVERKKRKEKNDKRPKKATRKSERMAKKSEPTKMKVQKNERQNSQEDESFEPSNLEVQGTSENESSMTPQKCGTSTKEGFSSEENLSTPEIVSVNKESLTEIFNSFYNEFSIGRWNKKQWTILIKSLVDEQIENTDFDKVNDLEKYIKGVMLNVARHYDRNRGIINEQTSPNIAKAIAEGNMLFSSPFLTQDDLEDELPW